MLANQSRYKKALQICQEVFNTRKIKLDPDHSDTLGTCYYIAIVLNKLGKYNEVFRFYQEVFNIHSASIKLVRQGLHLPSFKKRGIKVRGECATITRGLSQALFLQDDKSFLSNLETSAEIYERIAQGKQTSEREKEEVFALSKLLGNFKQQLGFFTHSLPLNLVYDKGYKTSDNLSSYIVEIEGNFAIHLCTSDHVVAIYRLGDDYAYFDSNIAFIPGLKNTQRLITILEKALKFVGYDEGFIECFYIEHFDVNKANNSLSDEDKQILTKEIKTERQLLAEQDKELGLIEIKSYPEYSYMILALKLMWKVAYRY